MNSRNQVGSAYQSSQKRPCSDPNRKSRARSKQGLRCRCPLDRPGIQNEGAIAAMDQDKVQHVEWAYWLFTSPIDPSKATSEFWGFFVRSNAAELIPLGHLG
jgi:hypothetical protein